MTATGGDLLAAFLSLPEQLDGTYRSARTVPVGAVPSRSVSFCGMGGSAAGAELVAAAMPLGVPAAVVREDRLPPHCGPDDLVVCTSYSGQTRETLDAYREAVNRGCRVVAIASGGTLAALAEADGVSLARVPEGLLPRAALGHLAGATLGVLTAAGVLPAPDALVEGASAAAAGLAASLGPEVPRPDNEARSVAAWVGDRVPVIWGSGPVGAAAAWRWKCAFNENGKVPAFASALPELDHHEVAGWSEGRGAGFCLVVLRHDGEGPVAGARLAATLHAIEASGLEWREVWARAGSDLARGLCLALVGDAASTYLADARGVDPSEMRAIDDVKARLAEQ